MRASAAGAALRAPGGGRNSAPSGSSPQSPRQLATPVRAVLAPPSNARPARPSPAQRGLGAQLLQWASTRWDGSKAPPAGTPAVAKELEEVAREADALDERRAAGEGGVAAAAEAADAPVPDIHAFLRPAGVLEARYVRVLSSLCALTYGLEKLTPSALMRRHRLKLVSTSKVCELRLREPTPNPADSLLLGDGTAAVPAIVAEEAVSVADGDSGLLLPAAITQPLRPADLAVVAGASASLSPVDRVTASLAAAMEAASAAAQGVYSAAVPYAGPLANNINTFTAGVAASLPVRGVAQQLQSATAVGHSSAIAAVATVSAALESTWGRDKLPKQCQSPTEWFIADDPQHHTRFFVIQGSDNLDHWRVNLTFDPVPFEPEAGLGVKVHRGVYEAAQQLYDRFLPLVQEHLASSPFAKVAFTGHSLGGSLGTVLLLMYVHRGVLPASAISPVYTFGAPAVFCEGAGGACGCSVDSQGGGQADACGVLGAFGLPEGAVRNVLMSRDIVPRAFACDYSLVADLLKRVSESFRSHTCLNSERTIMFDFVGKVLVLQPDPASAFVARGERPHPMLPPVAGLYVLREPTPFNTVAATLQRDAGYVREAVQAAISNLPAAAAAATTGGAAEQAPAPAPPAALAPAAARSKALVPAGRAPAPAPAVGSAREAAYALMNHPHPLDILADPGAYGDLGSISRYHNPDNYTRALGGVLRHRRAWRRIVGNAGSVGIRWFAPVLDPRQLRAASAPAPAAPSADGSPTRPAGTALPAEPSPERRSSPGGKQSLIARRPARRPSGDASLQA